MPSDHPFGRRRARTAWIVSALAAAALLAATAVAIARTFTVSVATVHLGGRSERIAADSRGVAVYELVPETTRHLLCTQASGCFGVWPPVKVHGRLTKAPGVRGGLGTLRRNGFVQLTLNGHPLYTFAPDGGQRGVATGNGIHSFGGTWFVLGER